MYMIPVIVTSLRAIVITLHAIAAAIWVIAAKLSNIVVHSPCVASISNMISPLTGPSPPPIRD
jgi:ABC-type thiamin/hydroxymethylpyrimidine transport system permease subunit